MRRILAVSLVVILMTAVLVPQASAGGRGPSVVAPLFGLAALALAAPFIIAGQVIAATTVPYRAPVVVASPPAYSAPAYSAPAYVEAAPAYGAPAPTYTTYARPAPARGPAVSRVVEYPHGRYLLRGDGVTTAYQWVWLPNPPPPPPR